MPTLFSSIRDKSRRTDQIFFVRLLQITPPIFRFERVKSAGEVRVKGSKRAGTLEKRLELGKDGNRLAANWGEINSPFLRADTDKFVTRLEIELKFGY